MKKVTAEVFLSGFSDLEKANLKTVLQTFPEADGLTLRKNTTVTQSNIDTTVDMAEDMEADTNEVRLALGLEAVNEDDDLEEEEE